MSKKEAFVDKKEAFGDREQQDLESGPSSFFPEKGPGMGKEVKIGLAVILVLSTIFGVLLVKRLRRPAPVSPAADEVAKTESATADKPSTKELFSSGAPGKSAVPAMVSTSSPTGGIGAASGASKWSTAGSTGHMKDLTYDSHPDPRPSHMPKVEVVLDGRSGNTPVGASSGQNWQTGPTAGAAPSAATPSPSTSGQMTTSISVNNSQQPFDPFARPTPAGVVPVGSAPAMAPASDAPAPSVAPSPASAASPSGVSPSITGGTLATDPGRQTTVPTYTSAPSSSFRSAADPPAAAPAGFALPSSGAGLRPLTPDAGRRPDGTYVVQPNENYWLISQRLYGSGAYFRALAEHNRKKFPNEDRLTAGDVISTPSVEELERNYAGLCPKPEHRRLAQPDRPLVSNAASRGGSRVYVVQAGDNLFNIAKYELNNAARWAEIYELNRDLLGDQVDHLTPGMKLALPGPAGQPAARTAVQSPDSLLRR